jgi:hypothetical protein
MRGVAAIPVVERSFAHPGRVQRLEAFQSQRVPKSREVNGPACEQ